MAQTRKIKRRSRWGYHLIVDARDCDPVAMRSKETIRAFVKELVSAIDMVAFGRPQIVMFGTGNKKGYTLVQLIETSDITAHFVEETNDIYLDVFSCKDFKIGDAMAVFNKYFSPGSVKKRFLTRKA
jgi:S-adenosylmethionine/arginine decarboxylase-like enzyme